MDELVVGFPTKCPKCGQKSLVAFGLDSMLQALATDQAIKLHANCAHHRRIWVANKIERRKLRDYMTAVYVSWLTNRTARAITHTSDYA